MNMKSAALLAAASLAVMAGPMSAQATTVTTDPALSVPVTQDDDDGDFPWGLLGLLGLAGLMGRKRDRDDVMVTRSDTNKRM